MAKVEPQELPQTMEDYLLSQLQEPVITKDGSVATAPDGHKLTKQEAIAINLLNQAMKGDIKTETPPFFLPILAKNISIFKKMQKNAPKIWIYEKKAVLLHRQNKLRGRTTAKSAAFFIVRRSIKYRYRHPVRKL